MKTPVKKQSQFKEFWRIFFQNKPATVGLVLVVLLLLMVIFAEQIVPYELAIEQHITVEDRLQPPSAEHPFGTDHVGRDMFARIIHGGRVSLTVGFIPVIISLIGGMLLGACAAYFGKAVENIIMRFCDVFACIPGTLLTLSFAAVLGAGLDNMMVALTITAIPGATRMVRALILNIVESDYIEAAKMCGTSDFQIMVRHILPNAMGPLILSLVSSIAGTVMMGAGLSFLGMGVQPPQPEWGYMLSESRQFMYRAPHMFIVPGIFIMLAILSLNLAGDGLRDALDPKLRR